MNHKSNTFKSLVAMSVESDPHLPDGEEAKQMNKVGGKFPTTETAFTGNSEGSVKLRFMANMPSAVNDSLALQRCSAKTGQSAGSKRTGSQKKSWQNIGIEMWNPMSREINRLVNGGESTATSIPLLNTQVARALISSPMGNLRLLALLSNRQKTEQRRKPIITELLPYETPKRITPAFLSS